MQNSKTFKTIWLCVALLIVSLATSTATTYYSGAATGDPTLTTSWWDTTGGTGNHPANFTSGDTFVIQNGHKYTVAPATTWTVNASSAGTAATVQINSGGVLAFNNTSGNGMALGGNLVRNGAITNLSASGGVTISFTSNGSWTGSGDLSSGGSVAKISVTVNSGVTLDATAMTGGFKLGSSNTKNITVNGTLNLGANTVNGNGSGSSGFTLGASGTLITATTSASGLPGIFTGFSAGKITLPTTASYVFNGVAAQVTGTTANNATMPNIVNNLTFNNAAGVTLSQPTEVDGTLALTAGKITGNVTLGGSATLSGGGSTAYVNGQLTVPFSAPSSLSYTFPVGTASAYSPVTIGNFTDAGSGTLTASATAGQNPNVSSSSISASKYIARYWTLTGSGFSSPTYNFTGTFVAGDIQGGANTASLLVELWDGGSWSTPAHSSTSTTVSATGLTAFGQFAAGELEILPVLDSLTKSAITTTTATLGATVVKDSGSAINDYGIVWGTSPDPTTGNNKIQAGTTVTPPNTFTVPATGLPAGTIVYYRGYATSANGTGYSTNDTFLTITNEPTVQASGVSGTSRQNGDLVFSWTRGNGAKCIVLVNAATPVDADPVDGSTYTANATYGSGSLIGGANYVAYLGTGNSVTLKGLSAATTYYVAVYELNGTGGSENYLAPPATGSQATVVSPIAALSWTGAVDSDWNNTNNWDYLQVPDAGTTANISFSGNLPVYSNQMAAASIGSVNLSGPLTIATNRFVVDAAGAVPLTVQPSGFLTVNTNGVIIITNSGSVTMTTPTSGTSPAIDVEGGTFIVANSSTFFMGDNTSSDTGIGAAFTNNGGNVVINSQLRVRSRDSRLYMSGGTLNVQGGINYDVSANDGRQFIRIAGGTANLGDVTINRATTAGGLSVEGGAVNSSSIRIGTGVASANSRMTGGTWTNTGAFYISDRNNAATSGTRNPYFTMSDGYLVTLGADGIVINNQGETSSTGVSGNGGILQMNGGTITAEGIQLNGPSVTANSYARFQFTDGTIYLGTVGLVANTAGSSMTAALTLSGGTLAAKADWTSTANLPISSSSILTFKAADETDTAHNITLNGIVSGGTGSLVKNGAGTLTLNGANTYGGSTTINKGSLVLGASATSASSAVDVASGATFDVSALSGFSFSSGQTLSGAGTVIGSITNGSGSSLVPGDSIGTITVMGNLTELDGVNNIFEVASDSNDVVEVTGNLALSGVNDVNVVISGGSLNPGMYDLIHYTGSITGDTNNLNLIGVPGYLTNRTDVHMISVVTTGLRAPTSVVWVGNSSQNDWDILNHTNWLNGASLDSFVNLDTVRFDDTGAANPNVNITDNTLVSSITVDSTANYSLAGSGSIGGSGSLTKTNTGTLVILSTNSYTGPTIIGQGTLEIAQMANAGVNSPIGAADNSTNNLVFFGSTLKYTGATASTDHGATLNDAGGTINVVNAGTTLTDNGTFAGAGALTKIGPGTLVLASANAHTGGTTVSNGVLQINNATALGVGGFTNSGATLKFGSGFTASETVDFENTCVVDLNNPSTDVALRGAWSGGGTVVLTNLNNSARTFTIGGDGDGGGTMTAFTGTLDCGTCTAFLRFDDGSPKNSGSPYATYDLGSGSMQMLSRNGGVTIDLGALKGGPNTVVRGRASGAGGLVNYSVGALGVDTVFAGSFSNSTVSGSLTALTKVGSGKLTLTGTSVHSDATTVNDGELRVDGAILNSAVTVNSGTLSGSGRLGQSVSVYGTLAPGDSGIGSLTVNGNLSLNGITILEVNKGAGTNDLVTGINNLYYSGTLLVTNLSGTLTNGTVFKLFSAQTYNGDFYGGITLPDLAPGLTWQTNLTVDGTIRIPPLTNSPVLVSAINGSTLTLSWPATQTGWTLEVQTNNLATGLTGTWTPVPNSDLQNTYSATIDPANETVFYRLTYTP